MVEQPDKLVKKIDQPLSTESKEGEWKPVEKTKKPLEIQKEKVETVKKTLQSLRTQKQHNSDVLEARKALMWINSELSGDDIKKETSESQKELDEISQKTAQSELEYGIETKTAYELEIKELDSIQDETEREKKKDQIQTEYISWYVDVLKLEWSKLSSDEAKKMSENLPDAWKELLINPELSSVHGREKLKKFREDFLRQIPTPDTEMNSETFDQYRSMFEQKTGLSLSEDQIKQLVEEAKKLREIPASEAEKKEQENNPPPIIDGGGRSGQEYEDYVWNHAPTLWEPNLTDANTWYSVETGKEATEWAKNAAKTIKEAMRKKYGGTEQQPWEFEKYIDRHAQNHSNFSASQPFLLQSLSQQRAYIYYPGGEIVECSATHGVGGINNISWQKWSSLWSKELIPDSNWSRNGNKILYRTAVKGLEWCNANDLSRLIRIHEQHGSATHGCTWLPLEEMKRFDAAIDSAGGGAQEIFK